MDERRETMPDREHATRLLASSARGDDEATRVLGELVYERLRRMAASMLASESPGHTLQATALVNEAWLRLIDQRTLDRRDEAAFFGLAATLMRRILVDHARARLRMKRGGGARRVDLDEAAAAPSTADGPDPDRLEAMDTALRELAELDERKVRLVELRFFAGMDEARAASLVGISRATASREWRMARSWLARRMQELAGEPARDDA